jgi:uncharacterized protein YdhG (YjbR/CyaY superfamily)
MSPATKKTANKPVSKSAGKSAKSSAENGGTATGFTAEEREAMRARAQEMKAEARASKDRAEGESTALAAIAAMKEPDRSLAKRVHTIITTTAPSLAPRTWYGMPAYALDDKVVCFFQSAQKFKTRYATFGFSAPAKLDDGVMWPVAFALTELNAAAEARIAALVKKAVG